MLSSRSSESAPAFAAATMPASSLTGMNAPESPPTDDDAITPPFFTASVSIASAATEPGAPAISIPIASRISATESPTAGRRRQRQIDDAEPDRRPQPARHLASDQLARARDLERHALDRLGDGGQVVAARPRSAAA